MLANIIITWCFLGLEDCDEAGCGISIAPSTVQPLLNVSGQAFRNSDAENANRSSVIAILNVRLYYVEATILYCVQSLIDKLLWAAF